MNLGPTEFIFLVLIALPIWAFVDAAIRPEPAWRKAGASKVLWLLLIGLGTFVCGLPGVVLAVVYLATIRPKVKAAMPPESEGESPS